MFCEVCQREIVDHDWPSHEQGKKHQKKLEAWRAVHCAIYVSNLQGHFSSAELQSYFSSFGDINNIKLLSRKDSAIVTYKSKEAADRTLEKRHHQVESRLISVVRRHSSHQVTQQQNTDKSREKAEQLLEKLRQLDSIEAQMKCLLEEWSLTKQRSKQIHTFVKSLQQAIQAVIPEASLQPFGSVVTGLGSVNCDLDVVLHFVEGQRSQQRQPILPQTKNLKGLKVKNGFITFNSLQQLPASKMCRVIMLILQKSSLRGFLKQFVPLTSARTPVLKFHYEPVNLDVDMTFRSNLSVRNTRLIEILLQLDDRVQALVFTLRFWLKLSGFCDNQATRITNYALFLLVYFYLENTEPRVLPTVEELAKLADETGCPRMEREGWDCTFTEDVKLIKQTLLSHRNTASVGELLGGFFSFYADIGLPYSVICPRTGIIHNVLQFRKAAQHEEKLKAFKFRTLCLQDPFDLSHNTLANVNQKCAHHFSRSLLETAEAISSQSDDWNLATILPKQRLTLVDDVIPVRDPLTVVLPFDASTLPETYWDCPSIADAQLKWHQSVLDALVQCLDLWKITCKGITEFKATSLSSDLKRKGDELGDADMKRLLLDEKDRAMSTKVTCDLLFSEAAQIYDKCSHPTLSCENTAVSSRDPVTSSEKPATSESSHTSSDNITSEIPSFSSEDKATLLGNTKTSLKCTATSSEELISQSDSLVTSSGGLGTSCHKHVPPPLSPDQSISPEGQMASSEKAATSCDSQTTSSVTLSESSTSSEVCATPSEHQDTSVNISITSSGQLSSSHQVGQCSSLDIVTASDNHDTSADNSLTLCQNETKNCHGSVDSADKAGTSCGSLTHKIRSKLDRQYPLKRIVQHRTCVHCETSFVTWYNRKRIASCLKAREQNAHVLDLERQITAKLCEVSELSTRAPLLFDVCLERVSYGQRVQMEISVEMKQDDRALVQFRSFLHGYGCKVLKSVLETTSS